MPYGAAARSTHKKARCLSSNVLFAGTGGKKPLFQAHALAIVNAGQVGKKRFRCCRCKALDGAVAENEMSHARMDTAETVSVTLMKTGVPPVVSRARKRAEIRPKYPPGVTDDAVAGRPDRRTVGGMPTGRGAGAGRGSTGAVRLVAHAEDLRRYAFFAHQKLVARTVLPPCHGVPGHPGIDIAGLTKGGDTQRSDHDIRRHVRPGPGKRSELVIVPFFRFESRIKRIATGPPSWRRGRNIDVMDQRDGVIGTRTVHGPGILRSPERRAPERRKGGGHGIFVGNDRLYRPSGFSH